MGRNEELLKALLNDETAEIQPVSRAEKYLKACCEKCGCEGLPEPVSRSDELLYELAEKLAHGGGDITTEELEVTENGTYTAPDGKAYTPVTVNVPVGEPVFQAPCGWWYKKNFVYSKDAGCGLYQGMLNGCSEMESLRVEKLANAYQFSVQPTGMEKLKVVEYPYQTEYAGGNTNSFSGTTAIDSMTLGSIGYPVTSIDFNMSARNAVAVLTIYCTSISAITIGRSPIGENTTVIYRDSTTGEVIEA